MAAAAHCPSSVARDEVALRQYSARALWVDDIVPEPDRDSGSIRSSWMLRILADAGYYVVFQPRFSRNKMYAQQLRFYGVDVQPVAPATSWDLQRANRTCKYDVIFISRPAVYQEAWPLISKACPGVPLVYDTVDLHFLRKTRQQLSAGECMACECLICSIGLMRHIINTQYDKSLTYSFGDTCMGMFVCT